MTVVKEVAFSACMTFVLIEIIYYLTPKDGAVTFIYGLIYTLIIFSAIITVIKMDFESYDFYSDFSSDSVYEMYMTSAEIQLTNQVVEALETIGIEVADVSPKISIDDDDNVTLESIAVKLKYFTDVERAQILLNSLFENSDVLEVTYNDG